MQNSLNRFAWLSIAAALITVGLKFSAYLATGSVGLLSDALESLVNLAGATMMLAMLIVAARPADADHAYGHAKAEYFASGFEGALILVAAASIVVASVPRLFAPQPLEQVGVGLAVAVFASLVNLGAALVLRRAGKQYNSIALEADSRHLLTDVWTSVGVVIGVGATALIGWYWLDPLVALLVAANIVWSGIQIVRQSVKGLMDAALPDAEQAQLSAILQSYAAQGVQFHKLRTRKAGAQRFIDVHILVPGAWTVRDGHEVAEQIETDMRQALPDILPITHLEPRAEAPDGVDAAAA